MTKCPSCQKLVLKPNKSWTYGIFRVNTYLCDCGTKFREYTKNGKLLFTLRLQKGKWKKVE